MRERLPTLVLVALVGAGAAYLAGRAAGTVAAIAATTAAVLAAALAVRVEPGSAESELVAKAANGGLLAVPGALTVYLGFDAGGFFPDGPALGAIVLALLLVLRVTLAADPFGGFSGPLALASGALSLYCLWTLLSGSWSDAPARALIESDRVLLYLLALILFGSLPRTPDNLRWLLRGVALGVAALAVTAFLTRVLPDVFPTWPGVATKRLSYPLTYWNALGILTSIGVVLCLHLTCSLREHWVMRALAAAVIPVMAATVLFTFSRGAIGAGIVAVALYAALGRPRGLLSGAVAVVPASVVAVVAAYGAELLASSDPTTAAAADQGRGVALVVLGCCVGAAILRILLRPLDKWLAHARLAPGRRRPVALGAAAACLLAISLATVALDGPGRADRYFEEFANPVPKGEGRDFRQRLSDPSGSGRVDHWRVGIDRFEESKLKGNGAGTYGLHWDQERPRDAAEARFVVDDAHSLYVEVLDELGIVGFLLILAALAAILIRLAPVRRGVDRPLYAALFAGALAWALHAGFDWDWEMPAVTLWLFALGGAALATPAGERPQRAPTQGIRVGTGLAIILVAIGPAFMFTSERKLDDAVAAFYDGDCEKAIAQAVASASALDIRGEPYELLGLCQAREGREHLGLPDMAEAIERDPANWEFHYGQALLRGAAGLDPTRAARRARQLNPHDKLTMDLLGDIRASDRRRLVRLTRELARGQTVSAVR